MEFFYFETASHKLWCVICSDRSLLIVSPSRPHYSEYSYVLCASGVTLFVYYLRCPCTFTTVTALTLILYTSRPYGDFRNFNYPQYHREQEHLRFSQIFSILTLTLEAISNHRRFTEYKMYLRESNCLCGRITVEDLNIILNLIFFAVCGS